MTNKVQSQNMSVQAIWNIRDARGLNQDEKAFLFVIASRGVMTSAWQTAAEDMGMKKDRFYRTRKALIAKNLIQEGTRKDDTTVYRLNEEVLATYVPAKEERDNTVSWTDSHTGKTHSHIENDSSQDENDDSHMSEEKVTKKVTDKETLKETSNAPVPGASEESVISEAKEEESSSVDSSLPVDSETPSLPLEVETAAGTADDWEDEEFEVFGHDGKPLNQVPAPVTGLEVTPDIEAILNGSTWPAKARSFFLDPTWEESKSGEDRARWAGFYADAALDDKKKEEGKSFLARQ